MGQLDLKPYNFLKLLDAAFSIYRRNFGLLFWIAAAFFVVPYFAEEIINLYYIVPEDLGGRITDYLDSLGSRDGSFDIEELHKIQNLAYYTIPISLILFIILPLSHGPLVNAIHQNAIGAGCGFREAFRIGWQKYLNLVLSFILLNMILAVVFSLVAVPVFLAFFLGKAGPVIGCLMFFVIGFPVLAGFIYIAVLFGLYSQGIVIENKRPLEALVRSARLIHGNWWRAFGIFFCLQIIVSIIYTFSQVAFSSLNEIILSINQNLEIFGHASVAMGLTVVQIFTTPILILGETILFYDLKVRREAYDLEMMIENFNSHV